jgi:hypothetical protein
VRRPTKPKAPASFPLLLAGHLLGDFIFQTDWQAAHKADPGSQGWRANQEHIRTYHEAISLFMLPVVIARAGGFKLWIRRMRHPIRNKLYRKDFDIQMASLFSQVTHSLIDRRWPVVKLQQITQSPDFAESPLGRMVTDQALHLIVLVIMSVWIDRKR